MTALLLLAYLVVPPQSVVDACTADALRYCSVEAMSRDHVRIGACMRRQAHLLSEACRAAVRDWRAGR